MLIEISTRTFAWQSVFAYIQKTNDNDDVKQMWARFGFFLCRLHDNWRKKCEKFKWQNVFCFETLICYFPFDIESNDSQCSEIGYKNAVQRSDDKHTVDRMRKRKCGDDKNMNRFRFQNDLIVSLDEQMKCVRAQCGSSIESKEIRVEICVSASSSTFVQSSFCCSLLEASTVHSINSIK